ncbi:MAG: hypothetical protein HYT76_03155 [Deltaproteobacteria bacterium]|nr:hypothetical protein [Deltaproteobacteria bacterium]
MNRKSLSQFFAFSLVLLFASVPLIAQEESDQWAQSGTVLEDPLMSRKGFYLSLSPHAGAEVIGLTRPVGGIGVRVGYGITPDLLIYLQNDWTLSAQFDVFFHFLDFYPHVAWFVWKELYLMAGGGYTIAKTSTGTTADGFSVQRGVTRHAFGGGGGIGYEVFRHQQFSINVEAEGVYRKISGGDYLQTVISGVLNYRF